MNDNKVVDVQNTMCELDDKIWGKYYPNRKTDKTDRTLTNAYIWLKYDIEAILCDKDIDTYEEIEDILSIINSS